MSRWFRHYAGMARDDKLVSVAIKTRQPVERVVWVWAAILESAAEIDDEGRYGLDAAEVAYFLRADEADILSVVSALEASGRLAEGRVVKWGNRQFSSDRSKERVAAHRERKRSERVHVDADTPSQNGGVTLPERHGNSPELETELETQTTEPKGPVVARAKAPPEHAQILDCLKTVLSEDHAKAVVEHRKKLKKPIGLHAAKLLAGQLSAVTEPNKAADLMISRGWQGFEPDWGVNAGLTLISSPSQSTEADPQTFVEVGTEEWDAWSAYLLATTGKKPWFSTCKTHIADGRYFATAWPPDLPAPQKGREERRVA